MTHSGAINLLGGYIKAYCDDYRDNPEELKRLLKTDRLVMTYVTEENIDYIVRENTRTGAANRRVIA